MGQFTIVIEGAARRSIERLPRDVQERVRSRIDALAENPRPHGVKRLTGRTGDLLRLRVGDYRVIYRVEDARLVVVVVTVSHRREVYR